MAIFSLDGQAPSVPASAYVADSAELIGNVVLGEHASVWPNVVIHGDGPEPIRIGARSNIQDGSVLHADPGKPLTIGDDVTIGHLVMLHGCTVGDGALVGIGSVVLNNARIGRGCLVGAGTLVTEGKQFADGSMIVGSPARVIRALGAEQIEGLLRSAQHYVENAARFKRGLQRIG